MLCVAAMSGGSTSAAAEIGKSTVEVGKIFGQTSDGLVLYALLLGTMLVTFIALMVIWFTFRALAAERAVNAAQTKLFVDSSNRQADALMQLAVATATQTQVQSGQNMTLARVEGYLARVNG